MSPPFQAGGPLSAEAASYIEREADGRIIEHLRRMDYVLLVEPRQQGKTSLMVRARARLIQEDYLFAYIDVTDLERHDEVSWYADIGAELSEQLGVLPELRDIRLTSARDWRELLRAIALQADAAKKRVVVVLDEIGVLSKVKWSEAFFLPMRKIFNLRSIQGTLARLTFVLCGAFHPRDLIADETISPFNIAQRVRLYDFTADQIGEIVMQLGTSKQKALTLAGRIHYWTGGQPYLTQALCGLLIGSDLGVDAVDRAMVKLQREDENHLPPILGRLKKESMLLNYLRRIHGGAQVQFNPAVDRRHKTLELLGVVKVDANGFCVIRNVIYSQAFFSTELADGALASAPTHQEGSNNILQEELGVPWLERSRVKPEATECSSELDHQRLQALIDALLLIPATSSFEGRSGLLHGIPWAQSLKRNPSIARSDLEFIVDQLLSLSKPSSSSAPICIFLENAESHVRGSELARTIADARMALSGKTDETK